VRVGVAGEEDFYRYMSVYLYPHHRGKSARRTLVPVESLGGLDTRDLVATSQPLHHITATDGAEREGRHIPTARSPRRQHSQRRAPAAQTTRLCLVSSVHFTSPGLCNIHIKLSLLFPALLKLPGKLEAAEPGVAPWACEAWEPWAARGMGMAAEAFVGFAVGEDEDMAGRW
jgi:hypothetical protein